MRLLLTGATGFTGQHLSRAARECGYEVFGLTGDLLDEQNLKRQLAQFLPTHIIHLAGISRVTNNLGLKYYEVNLMGSLNLLHALTQMNSRPEKIILASSANVYGNNPNSPIRETEPPSPVSHYAMSKLAIEYLSRSFADRLPLVITRPFNYTGVGHDQFFVIPKIIEHVQRRTPIIELGNIDVLREYNDVRDVCQIYLRLLTHGQSGATYNIASGRFYSLRDVLAILEQASDYVMKININPDLIRANEIFKLYGDKTLLEGAIGPLEFRSLEDTLNWMLHAQ